MNDSLVDIISFKHTLIATVTGGAITITAANVISIFGVAIASMGLLLGFLQWRTSKKVAKEKKRTNDISQNQLDLDKRKFNLEEKKLKYEMDKNK